MKYLTPCQVIRFFCLTCESSKKAVKECPNVSCPLWPYRLGHNPNRQGIGKRSDPSREAKSGQFLPRRGGERKKLQLITDGKKRIRVLVEDMK